MDERIATPRLENPRVKIEGGSVGIAGAQTGIYPVASPGGWQLIGRTPVKLYDADREKPVLLEADSISVSVLFQRMSIMKSRSRRRAGSIPARFMRRRRKEWEYDS